jgi:DNA repair protein RadD
LPRTTVHTIQGALARGASLAAHDIVFLDECHHIVSPEWVRALALLSPSALIVGMTATPERADGTGLDRAFDAMVTTASYSDLLRDRYLTPCSVIPCNGVDPALAYLRHGRGRPGVLFAMTIADCRAAVATLRAAGVRAACLDSSVASARRAALVAAYDRGDLDVLASPMALAEGFDSPRAEVCILARQCVHAGTYLQIVGRVLRVHPGKSRALVLDCTGAAERHGHPTIDREYSLTGKAIRIASPPSVSRPAQPRSGVAPRLAPTRGPDILQQALGWFKGWLRAA